MTFHEPIEGGGAPGDPAGDDGTDGTNDGSDGTDSGGTDGSGGDGSTDGTAQGPINVSESYRRVLGQADAEATARDVKVVALTSAGGAAAALKLGLLGGG